MEAEIKTCQALQNSTSSDGVPGGEEYSTRLRRSTTRQRESIGKFIREISWENHSRGAKIATHTSLPNYELILEAQYVEFRTLFIPTAAV